MPADVASLVRGEKPTGSTQTHRHCGLRLSEPAVPVLREHRRSSPRPSGRWQAWPDRTHPDVPRSCLLHHIQRSTRHSLIPPENTLAKDAPWCGSRPSLWAGCFRRRAGRRATDKPPARAFLTRAGQHGKQLSSTFLCEVEVLMPLQRFDERGEKRDQAFDANAVGGVPDQEQRVLNVRTILSRTWPLQYLLHFFYMVEQPSGVSTMVSSRCHKGIQQCPFLCRRCLTVLRDGLLEQCASCLITQ
jgi:hypothetical protein